MNQYQLLARVKRFDRPVSALELGEGVRKRLGDARRYGYLEQIDCGPGRPYHYILSDAGRLYMAAKERKWQARSGQ